MRIFISSSNSNNINKTYNDLTVNACTILSRLGYDLVFNGSDNGMNSKAYLTFKFENKKCYGINTTSYKEELEGLELDNYIITNNIFDKYSKIYDKSDVFLFLPGGIESLSGLFSMLEEKINKKDNKTIIIFNYNNCYTPLLNMLKSMHDNKFIKEDEIKKIMIVNDIDAFKMYFERLGKRN